VEWFNLFGFVFMIFIMLPNIVYAIRNKNGYDNIYHSKSIELLEQIGRFGCVGFMIFNVPGTWFGWTSDTSFALYLIIDSVLVILYCVLWIVFWKKHTLFKAFALSVLPSIVFLFSGVMSRSVLLILAALVFAPAHIIISYKNVDSI